MSDPIVDWLTADSTRHVTFHVVPGQGPGWEPFLVCTAFEGERDPDTGAPRDHALGGGDTVLEAFTEAVGCLTHPEEPTHE